MDAANEMSKYDLSSCDVLKFSRVYNISETYK